MAAIEEKTKQKMRMLGGILFPVGLVMMICGSGLQVFIYLASGGTDMTKQPILMVWGGIAAAIGIVMLIAGKAMQIVGNYKDEK